MTQGLNLIGELSAGAVEACVISTYTIHFPFFEGVVLPKLTAAGCRRIAVLVDAAQCATAIQDPSARPRFAGSEYALLPIRTARGGAFHPKVMLLAGAKTGRLYIGSHNLTLAGFTHNREITNRITIDGKADRDGIVNAAEALQGLLEWSVDLPGAAGKYFEDLRRSISWLTGPRDASAGGAEVVFSRPEGPSLWDRVRRRVDGSVSRAFVVGAFFDEGLDFLKTLQRDLTPREVVVGIDPLTVSVNARHARALESVRFADARRLAKGEGYLHAKAIGLQLKDGAEILISGSANPSRPAWTGGHAGRNAEAVVVHRATRGASLLASVGLERLCEYDTVKDRDWEEITRRIDGPDRRKDSGTSSVVLAFQDGSDYVVESRSLPPSPVKSVALLAEGHGNGRTPVGATFSAEQGTLRISAASLGGPPRLIQLSHRSGSVTLAVPYHAGELARRSQSTAQRDLERALASLDGDAGQLGELLKLVEKAVFSEGGTGLEVPEAPTPGPKGGDRRKATPESPRTLEADLDEISRRHNHHRRQVLSADLVALLDALIRRLYLPLEKGLADGGLAEEAMPQESDGSGGGEVKEPSQPELITGQRLAALCRKKIDFLLKRRLIPRLESAAEEPEREAFRTVTQAAAVLSLVRTLCALELAPPSPLPRYARLVDRDSLRDFLWFGAGYLCSPKTGLLGAALRELKVGAAAEVSITRGLLLWAAYEGEIDQRWANEGEDREEIAENLLRLSDLFLALQDSREDRIAVQHARDAFFKTLAPRELPAALDWMARHVAWAKAVHLASKRVRKTGPPRRDPSAGDVVVLTRDESLQPYLAVEVVPGRVTVADPDHDNGVRKLATEYVSVVDIEESGVAVA